MIELKAAATSHSLPLPPPFILSPTRPDAPPPLPTSAPTSFPPLLLPSDRQREDRPEVNLPPRMGLGFALGPRYEVRESSATAAARPARGFRADYGFVATMDREIRRDQRVYWIWEHGFMDPYREDGSTQGQSPYPARAGDSLTGIGDDITGVGYCLTGTAGTHWGSCTAGAARRGW
ncbi:hypothetical protein Tco_0975132 [Tanacetum coccineum]|uniref:Uncharacterized protein n=1 Tax=Tanacetum coccineum TaxID=301880 RepID=A0ABQ5EDK2_9ASTR